MKRTMILLLSLWASHCLKAMPAVPTDTIRLQLLPAVADSIVLDEVVVKGHRRPGLSGDFSDFHPVELVTVGGANGDLYKALQTMPGTQVQGESGRLLVRGGSSEETQTFIDGMHVLNPYTSTYNGSPSRSRYSTFLFEGINLSTGGAPSEYGQALSAVLPLETKDKSLVNKLGINASVVGAGGGGTRTFRQGSLSLDLTWQDMGLYDRCFPSRKRFESPYRFYSGATQFRFTPGAHTLLKVYAQYDRTGFSVEEGDDVPHIFSLAESNAYLNATLRHRTSPGWEWFAGVAYSHSHKRIGGASEAEDRYTARRQELHVKAKVAGWLFSRLRLQAGAEGYVRRYRDAYCLPEVTDWAGSVSPSLAAVFASLACFPWQSLKAEASFRAEYDATNRRTEVLPRMALYYDAGDFLLSATAGRYAQQAGSTYLLNNPALRPEHCTQYNLGIQYNPAGRTFRAEAYYKDYRQLALWENGVLTGNGHGYSKGFDVFFNDPVSVRNAEYQLAYTYNVARRKYGICPELTTPQYNTRHNLSVVVKYNIRRLRTIVGLTNTCASGRPWHNPERPGLMNDEAKPYYSLDLGITYIPHKKVIVHASVTNLSGRCNEYGRRDGLPVVNVRNRFYYIGVFITLGRKAAYDVSNF